MAPDQRGRVGLDGATEEGVGVDDGLSGRSVHSFNCVSLDFEGVSRSARACRGRGGLAGLSQEREDLF